MLVSRREIENNLLRNVLRPVGKNTLLGYKSSNPIKKNRCVFEHESHIWLKGSAFGLLGKKEDDTSSPTMLWMSSLFFPLIVNIEMLKRTREELLLVNPEIIKSTSFQLYWRKQRLHFQSKYIFFHLIFNCH